MAEQKVIRLLYLMYLSVAYCGCQADSLFLWTGLIAVAADDKVLRLFDVEVGRLVRVFQGHTDRVTDLCFSEDGKLLLSAAMDATVRVWDVVAAKQMDSMHVGNAVTALSLSPAMDLLATSHVNRNGIYLW